MPDGHKFKVASDDRIIIIKSQFVEEMRSEENNIAANRILGVDEAGEWAHSNRASKVTLSNNASGARLRGGYKNQGYCDPHMMYHDRGSF